MFYLFQYVFCSMSLRDVVPIISTFSSLVILSIYFDLFIYICNDDYRKFVNKALLLHAW